jgi:hypothetical protein
MLSSPTWCTAVESVFLCCLSAISNGEFSPNFNGDIKIMIRAFGVFSVLGGHIDSYYPGSVVKINQSSTSYAGQLGVITSYNYNSDLVHVELFPCNTISSTGCSQTILNKTKTLRIPQEQIHRISRCSIHDIQISEFLLGKLLETFFSFENFQISALSKSLPFSDKDLKTSFQCEEEKRELFFAEEKSEPDNNFTNPLVKQSSLVGNNIFLSYIFLAACRSLSVLLSANDKTYNVLKSLSSESELEKSNERNFKNFLISSLHIASSIEFDGKSPCGIADTSITELFLTMLIAVRSMLKTQREIKLLTQLKDECGRSARIVSNHDVDGDGDRCLSPLGGASVGASISLADTNDARGGDQSQSDSDSQISSVYGEERENKSISTTRSGRSLSSTRPKKKKGDKYPDDVSIDNLMEGLENLTEEQEKDQVDVEQQFISQVEEEMLHDESTSASWQCNVKELVLGHDDGKIEGDEVNEENFMMIDQVIKAYYLLS